MSSKNSWSRRFLPIFILIAAAIAFIGQVNYDTWRRFGEPRIAVAFNVFIEPQPLTGEMAKWASFGNREFLASWYWLQFIQYYGGGDPQGKYRKLAELFEVITDLSPRFLYAYQIGLLVLPGENFVDEAIKLGEKGQKNLPMAWQPPYYTGLVHHINRRDFVAAAQEFEQAAQKPDAPAITKLFAAIYYKQADKRETAYAIFKTVYETSENDFTRERAAKYVAHFDILFALEDAVASYRQRHNRLPSSLDELIRRGFINEIPPSPLNRVFTYDPKTGLISDDKIVNP